MWFKIKRFPYFNTTLCFYSISITTFQQVDEIKSFKQQLCVDESLQTCCVDHFSIVTFVTVLISTKHKGIGQMKHLVLMLPH